MDTDIELARLKMDRNFWKLKYTEQKEQYEHLWQAMEASRPDGFDLYKWLQDHITWSMETFGDGRRTEGLCKHIEKEVAEVRAEPNDIMEAIDILILGFDLAWRMGYSAREICLALARKQEINQERQWVKKVFHPQNHNYLLLHRIRAYNSPVV